MLRYCERAETDPGVQGLALGLTRSARGAFPPAPCSATGLRASVASLYPSLNKPQNINDALHLGRIVPAGSTALDFTAVPGRADVRKIDHNHRRFGESPSWIMDGSSFSAARVQAGFCREPTMVKGLRDDILRSPESMRRCSVRVAAIRLCPGFATARRSSSSTNVRKGSSSRKAMSAVSRSLGA